MCTVSYLPLLPAGFLLTSSRDEKITRPLAAFPTVHTANDQTVFFPQDPQGAGSWIAASSRLTVCLLNGAFRAHTPQPPYRHSRGLVVLSVFEYPSVADWLLNYAFEAIEPFTLVIVESEPASDPGYPTGAVERLWDVRWDGHLPHVRLLDPKAPRIWSSATLYSDEVIARRQQWFTAWLCQQSIGLFSTGAIRDFHRRAGAGDNQNAVLMNRGNGMQTLSLTSVRHEGCRATMYYEDLLTDTMRHQSLFDRHEYATAY